MRDVQSHNARDRKPEAKAAARRVLSRYLTGEPVDQAQVMEALEQLGQDARRFVARLQAGLPEAEEPAASLCEEVAVLLQDDQWEAELRQAPELARHFKSCSSCQKLAEAFGRLAPLRESWLELARELKEKETPWLLRLTRNGWQWLNRFLEPLTTLSRQALELRPRLGEGWLVPAPVTAHLGGPGPAAAPLGLALEFALPDGLGGVKVYVNPHTPATLPQAIWIFRVEASPDLTLPFLMVGIGAESPPPDIKTLRPGRPVEFHLPPPTGQYYRLYVTWTTPGGTLMKQQFELLLDQEPEKGP